MGTSCARFVSPLLKNRHFKQLAPVPFHRMIPYLNTDPGRSGIKVALYVGALLIKSFPTFARDVIEVLTHHGVGIFMPEGQGCCGIPAISSGDTKTFNRLVDVTTLKNLMPKNLIFWLLLCHLYVDD